MKRVELQLLLLGLVFGLGALFCLRMPVTFLSVLAEENCCIPPHASSAAARFRQGAIVTVLYRLLDGWVYRRRTTAN
jgi:hypothetical protein